jgi:hypothetical protein
VLVRLTRPEDVPLFCDYMRNAHVDAVPAVGVVVNVNLVGAPTRLHEERELRAHLRTWNELNPGRAARVL